MSRCIICNYSPNTDEEKNYMTESHDICYKCAGVIEDAVRDYDWTEEEREEVKDMDAIDDYTITISQTKDDVKREEYHCDDPECGEFCECNLDYQNKINDTIPKKPVDVEEQDGRHTPTREQEQPPAVNSKRFFHV